MKKNIYFLIEILILLAILLTISLLIFFGQMGVLEFLISILIFYIINTLISIYLFISERNFETKISWLILIVVIPILGQIAFLLLGKKNNKQISKIEYEKDFAEFANPNLIISSNDEEINPFQKKISNITKRSWKNGSFKIYKHGFEAYESLFEDITNAKKYIHIEMYIIKPSEIYDKLKKILIKKKEQGLDIRIIVDDFGKWLFSNDEIIELKSYGIEIKIFNKINFIFLDIEQSFRLHRKSIIIDGNIVHNGGTNLSDEYASFSKKYGYWVDINSRITGDICNDFSQLFLFTWFKITNQKLDSSKYLTKQKNNDTNTNVILFEEDPNIEEYVLEKILMNCISSSSKKIRIATPYFIPSKKILEQLKFALLEGVEVEIFIPGRADKKYVLETTHLYLDKLILKGANVYELQNMFLHSKIGTFDQTYGYLGTINWDMRSLYSNFETLNLLSGNIVNDLDAIFDEYKIYSKKIKIRPKNKNPFIFFKKILLKSFAPLM